MTHLTWRDVFACHRWMVNAGMPMVSDAAERVGYEFFGFNGWVYRVGGPVAPVCKVEELR